MGCEMSLKAELNHSLSSTILNFITASIKFFNKIKAFVSAFKENKPEQNDIMNAFASNSSLST